MDAFYLHAADFVVVFHAAYVGFVVFGLVAILWGVARDWKWVRHFWFRIIHFLMIAVVVVEDLVDVLCPLTAWENEFRAAAGEPVHEGSFIGRLAKSLLFIIPDEQVWIWHTAFGAVVLLVLIVFPPRQPAWPRWLASLLARGGSWIACCCRRNRVP
jgi:hypothetical protein